MRLCFFLCHLDARPDNPVAPILQRDVLQRCIPDRWFPPNRKLVAKPQIAALFNTLCIARMDDIRLNLGQYLVNGLAKDGVGGVCPSILKRVINTNKAKRIVLA